MAVKQRSQGVLAPFRLFPTVVPAIVETAFAAYPLLNLDNMTPDALTVSVHDDAVPIRKCGAHAIKGVVITLVKRGAGTSNLDK